MDGLRRTEVPPLSWTPITLSDRRAAYGKVILEGDSGRGAWKDTKRAARVMKKFGLKPARENSPTDTNS
jgi:hypothetical protein